MTEMQKLFNEGIPIFLGIGFLIAGISLMIGNDFYNTYQFLANEHSRVFLPSWSLSYFSSTGLHRLLVWIGVAGVLIIFVRFLYEDIKSDTFYFTSGLMFLLEAKIFLTDLHRYWNLPYGRYFWD